MIKHEGSSIRRPGPLPRWETNQHQLRWGPGRCQKGNGSTDIEEAKLHAQCWTLCKVMERDKSRRTLGFQLKEEHSDTILHIIKIGGKKIMDHFEKWMPYLERSLSVIFQQAIWLTLIGWAIAMGMENLSGHTWVPWPQMTLRRQYQPQGLRVGRRPRALPTHTHNAWDSVTDDWGKVPNSLLPFSMSHCILYSDRNTHKVYLSEYL